MRAGAVAAALLLVPTRLAAQAVPTFMTSVETVYVDVFVTRDGGPVPGLTPGDFEVRDNGVKQEVTLARLEGVPIVAVLAFDVSGSVVGEGLEDLRPFDPGDFARSFTRVHVGWPREERQARKRGHDVPEFLLRAERHDPDEGISESLLAIFPAEPACLSHGDGGHGGRGGVQHVNPGDS